MTDKHWIHEKCNTNTPPKTVPLEPPAFEAERTIKSMNKDELQKLIKDLQNQLKEPCLDLHFVSRLKKYTRLKDIKNFIKTFMDWYIDNNLKTNNFWLYRPYYINENNECVDIPDSYGHTVDMCYDLTGKTEEDFADLFYNCRRYWIYRNYLIRFSYDEKYSYSADRYYKSNPQFCITSLDKVERIG